MRIKQGTTYCTIDHTNKLSDRCDFDPYQYWLDQSERRKEVQRRAKQASDGAAAVPKKSRLK